MESSAQPERLNQEGFAAFQGRVEESGAIVMLNLLRFKPDGGQERYGEYGAAVTPLLAKAGGRVVFAGDPATALLGDSSWDMVVLVEYPSRKAFLDMLASPAYQEVGHLRTEALIEGELHPMDPAAKLT